MANMNEDDARGFTIVIVKPDGMRRDLRTAILDLYSNAGLNAVKYREYKKDSPLLPSLFAEHYREHKNKEFYQELVSEMAKGPICVMHMVSELSSEETVKKGRAVMEEIREKYAESRRHNTVHASDSPEAARRESRIWFAPLARCVR